MTKERVVRQIKENEITCSKKYMNIITHHSHINPELLVDKLNKLSMTTGYRRFNIFIVGNRSVELLENIRDVILNNYVFTINIYVLSEEQLKVLAHELCNGEIGLLSPKDLEYFEKICGESTGRIKV